MVKSNSIDLQKVPRMGTSTPYYLTPLCLSVTLIVEQVWVQTDFQTEVWILVQKWRRTELGMLGVLFITSVPLHAHIAYSSSNIRFLILIEVDALKIQYWDKSAIKIPLCIYRESFKAAVVEFEPHIRSLNLSPDQNMMKNLESMEFFAHQASAEVRYLNRKML